MLLRILILIGSFILGLNVKSYGQFQSASIGIDGLTCSMCSNSVERLLKQLPFINTIEMDLNLHTANITFVPDEKVEIYKIAKKVNDAGYSIRFLKAIFNFDSLNAQHLTNFTFQNDSYTFLKNDSVFLNGNKEIQFIGKKYLTKKEYLIWYTPSIKLNKLDNSYYITL